MNEKFAKAYEKAHPKEEADASYDSRLNALSFANTKFNIRHWYIDTKCDFFKYNSVDDDFIKRCKVDENLLIEDKGMWLFWLAGYENIVERFESLLIEINDPKLKMSDYAVLLYVSYQEESIRKTFEGLPLKMLYEIYEPIMEANIASWFEYVEAACERQKLSGTPIETIF
jgi:hypothetical protein